MSAEVQIDGRRPLRSSILFYACNVVDGACQPLLADASNGCLGAPKCMPELRYFIDGSVSKAAPPRDHSGIKSRGWFRRASFALRGLA